MPRNYDYKNRLPGETAEQQAIRLFKRLTKKTRHRHIGDDLYIYRQAADEYPGSIWVHHEAKGHIELIKRKND